MHAAVARQCWPLCGYGQELRAGVHWQAFLYLVGSIVMRQFFAKVAGLLLTLVFLLPAQAQTTEKPFPANTLEAKAALQARLQAIGYRASDVVESRPRFQDLVADLNNVYDDVPPLEEIKRLLYLLANPNDLSAPVALVAPDAAPLHLVAFARQVPRWPNPDLKRVQKQSWPADLSHGEKVALQTYTLETVPGLKAYGKEFDKVYDPMNAELRSKGTVSPKFALLHERLQSAFRKAQPFAPPIEVSRGIFEGNTPQMQDFLKLMDATQKQGKPYVVRGYVSTSVGNKVRPPFDLRFVHLHIKVVHGLDVYPISLFPGEGEVLLNHNSNYLVRGMRMEGGRWHIDLDQLPP
jgi:hypothetical protein